ncbi:hypothetical protein [Marinobacter persicus]|uniref:Uncharacterized protein n=1 Tax=Marinobacter persicus TaxID=930118 RepID=A0A2S6G791_9GAMM|nr:hypothetical protein [Marinobacter persicus]PPK51677.1 hypothetical protein BY455_11075 [Marinobacter persicus]PPK54897.1 hypothetical protein B0H24_100975 [Marinobacter persicus]PPK58615.1 hypothetical protein BY454_10875 [Marinobacter persicus]
MNDLMSQAVDLMIAGMGFVFAFLLFVAGVIGSAVAAGVMIKLLG